MRPWEDAPLHNTYCLVRECAAIKAAVCREFGKPLIIETIEIDPPQAGEVKVQVSACAICHSDIHYMDGAWGGTLPAVYGHEAAGVVEQIGPGVSAVKPGDHVVVSLLRSCGQCYFCSQGELHVCEAEFALDQQTRLHGRNGEDIQQGLRTGAFAEHVVVSHSQVALVPRKMRLESASLLACGVITGLGAVVNTAKVPAGASVAVVGTGGVGLNCVQGAAMSGAQPVIAIDISPEKLETAKEFGATHTINPAKEHVADAIRDLTGGRGADYVFVAVGSAKAVEDGLGWLRTAGTLVIVGMPASGVVSEIEALRVAYDSWRILGSRMGSTRLQADVPRLVTLYEHGRLKLDELISARYPLEEINQAIDSVRRGEALRNVIVF